MKRRRQVLLMVVAALALTLVGFTVATQYAASSLRYQRRLGDPFATLGGARLYAPWSWMGWDSDYAPYAPALFSTVRLIGWGSVLGP